MNKIKSGFRTLNKVIVMVFAVLAVFAVFLSILSPNSIRTDKPDADKIVMANRAEFYKVVNDPELQKTQQGRAYVNIYKAMLCKLIGEACTNNPNDADRDYNSSLVSQVGSALMLPYANPPSSGTYWVYSSLKEAGFVPKTLAAEGIGSANTRPLAEMWKTIRNLAYLVLTLFLIIIGFLVMFRFKVNPQTIITVENAIPRIVITLLLITFSFAISGFLIDFMYVTILVGASALAKAGNLGVNLPTQFIAPSLGNLWDFMFPPHTPDVDVLNVWKTIPVFGDVALMMDLGTALFKVLPIWIQGLVRALMGIPLSFLLAKKFLWDANDLGILKNLSLLFNNVDVLGNSVGTAPGAAILAISKIILVPFVLIVGLVWGAGLILGFLIFVTILMLFFRIFFMFIASYIKILLYIIFSPFILIMNVFPGQKSFTQWVRNIAGELSVFTISIYMMILGRIIVNVFENDEVLGLWRPPFLYSIPGRNLALIIGMGIIFLIPQFANVAKQKISGSKGSAFKIGPSLFFGGIGAVGGGALGSLGQFGSISHGISGLSNIAGKFGIKGGERKLMKPPTGPAH